jgi:transcriptional regulator with PAS, ATPase and Fis domain
MTYKDEVRVKTSLPGRDVSPLDTETLIAILDNVYKGVVCVDTDGRITFLSRSNEKFYNLKPGEAIGKHVTEVIEKSRLHVVAKTGKPEVGVIMKVKDGEYRVVERIPIKKGGKVIGAIGKIMFDDIEKAKVLIERINRLQNEVSTFREQIRDLFQAKYTFSDIIGQSTPMERVKNVARKAAHTTSTVLIQGESGTGKELFAHAIHNASPRRKFPFVRVNCASIPPELFESEFFGYEEGAFTGARRRGKKGQFQLAHQGTIFLDEVSELPIYVQAKLLRVLQEKEVMKIGSDKPIQVDFRLIASTNKNLEQMVNLSRFREDLFYRLNVLTLTLPPLRNRGTDLEILVTHFVRELNAKLGTRVRGFSDEAWEILHAYEWKGNVRELRNVVERVLTVCQDDTVEASHLHSYFLPNHFTEKESVETPLLLKGALIAAERKAITRALDTAKGNKNQASRLLGISRSSLYQKMKEYGASSKP